MRDASEVVVAEHPESGHTMWALLEEDGSLRPTEAFRRLLGPLPPGAFRSPEELATAAGFHLHDGVWQRGEERLRARVVPVPGGRIVKLTPGEGDEREVRLLRITAHDLRGPLANVRSYVGLLLGGRQPLEPRVQRSLQVVRRNADKALALVEDTIDSLRLDRDGLPVEPHAVPLGPALEKALERLDDRAEPAQVTREVHVPEQLPDVWAEKDRLVRVLLAPLEHLTSRAEAGTRLTVDVVPGPTAVELRCLLTPGDAVSPAPFSRDQRMLEEHKLEDAVRMDVARRMAGLWGGELETLDVPDAGGRGFLLRLALPPTVPGQAEGRFPQG
ncbi:MAG: hypothetical protein L0Y66_07070 [Myxococcaceae bacterium]|nr:hypothetical protein [Myxococcaceae bacterium]